jgi:hypothetical protein
MHWRKLSSAKESGSGFLSNAPLGVVVCGEENESDVWIEDCSIFSGLFFHFSISASVLDDY